MGLRSFYRLIPLWIPLALAVSGPSYGQVWQSLSMVEQEAESFLKATLGTKMPNYESHVTVNKIDNRLRLPQCDKPLTYRLHDKSLRASNVTLRALCEGQITWSFYLTAKVAYEGPVLVAAMDIARYQTLSETDVKIENRRITNISGNHLSGKHLAVGQQTTRALRAGDTIKASNLSAPQVIAKGDHVTVTAVSDGISVSTAGTAMGNGRVGEQIRVQNNKTERVIKARVTAAGQVQVRL